MAFPSTAPPEAERSGLERLDDAVVPALQRGARATARVAASPLRGLTRVENAVAGRLAGWGVAHRRALILLLAALAVIGSSVHLERYPRIQQAEADRRAAAAEQTVSEPGQAPASRGDALAGGAQIVGPAIGERVAAYIEDRHAALAELPGARPSVAVVSFTEYVTAAEALAGVPDGARIHAAQLRVPAAGEEPFQTEVVSNDLLGSVERALAAPMEAFAQEEASIRSTLPTVSDPAWRVDYEARLEELRAVRNLVNAGAGTVFAVIVEAPAERLRALLDVESVRLIDVAPGETELGSSGFFGLKPEDRQTVTYGVPG